MSRVPIGPGTEVTLNFQLSLPDGQLIDQTGASGATFKFADGSLLPGFEQALVGLFAGDQTLVTLSSDQGFGAVNEDNIHWMKRSDFARELLLEEGLVVSFQGPEGELPGIIKQVREEVVEVDFNHPLAGREIVFEADIIEVVQVTSEIAKGMSIEPFTIRLASPRGFCAGVDRAIAIVERALDQFGAPIYVRHEVVHNKHVVETLTQRGAVFVEEIDEIPAGSTCIFSAHGVSKAVEKAAEDKGLHVFDATCPLVTKVHMEVAKAAKENLDVILIGHEGHPEVEGTLGQMPSDASSRALLIESPEDVDALTGVDPDRLQFVTQTTLSVDDTEEVISALRKRFPDINGPRKDDICYATQNEQDAVKALAKESELILVVGSKNSSNSNRLRELAERLGARAFLIDHADEVEKDWLRGIKKVGVTSGASAPEVLVQAVIHRLEEAGGQFQGEIKVAEEMVEFSLPKALR